jgi:glycopeptide antibiotics resistance protein
MGKKISGGLLALYIVTLVWIVLFKLTFNISKILHYQHRSLNLIPFAAPSRVHGRINYGEIILNCLFFIPLGLLLNVNFKKAGFLPKLFFIVGFSICAELIQYIFAIGATDITDVMMNTAGGVIGMKLYDLNNKYIKTEKLDRVIVYAGSILLLIFVSIHVTHWVRR